MPTIQVNDQTMYYETLGSGSPVLLMHGWVQIGDELRPLANNIAAAGYQVILPDLPGYGRSVLPFRGFPPNFYHQDATVMGDFLQALGLSNIHIMGFSDGGETALLMPILHPDRCRTVIAWGAVGVFEPGYCAARRRGLPPTWITDKMRARHPGQDVDLWPYQWVEAVCAMEAAGGDISVKRAAEIKCPLLLILGDQDALNPVRLGQAYIEAASKRKGVVRKLEVFPGVGHEVHEQQPEPFLALVLDFLKSHDR